MNTVCQRDQCTGCMACLEVCPKDAITISDSLHAYNAEIDPAKCVGCDRCHKICQNNRTVELSKPIKWYQGWAEDNTVRAGGSSGGAATALMRAFVREGGYVCSCLFQEGKFVFRVTNRMEEIDRFKGSKYVKSDPSGAYRAVKNLLQTGNKVLFVGLPCQVAAMKIFVGDKLQEDLYTADLVCHGTPSHQLLELFLQQYGYTLSDLKDIKFRIKGKFQVRDGYKGVSTTGVTDSYLISFLNGLCYTENCYNCRYAQTERVSDITLGDSWGTNLPQEEINQCVSLILCQTEKWKALVERADLKRMDVDIENAIANNKQLRAPMAKPTAKDAFFSEIRHGKKYNRVIFHIYPKQSFRQWVKMILIKSHLYHGGGMIYRVKIV